MLEMYNILDTASYCSSVMILCGKKRMNYVFFFLFSLASAVAQSSEKLCISYFPVSWCHFILQLHMISQRNIVPYDILDFTELLEVPQMISPLNFFDGFIENIWPLPNYSTQKAMSLFRDSIHPSIHCLPASLVQGQLPVLMIRILNTVFHLPSLVESIRTYSMNYLTVNKCK